ncbi:MAG: recombination-associated protein RdgC [Deltaproteobacteria bacterium]|nr:recombination-associated protein RdgC [Deltaproteobacteria bacterium]
MPALFGSATFKRFFIGAKPDKGFLAKAARAANARRFAPTTEVETVSFGWVPMTDPLADKLLQEDLFVGEHVCLGFRMDERVVRAADVRDELKMRTRELQYERGRRLTRSERGALKEVVLAEMRARATIRRKVAELVWNPERQEARLFGANKASATACCELFERTFEISMEEVTPDGLMHRAGFGAARPAPEPKKVAAAKEGDDDAPF